MTRTDKPVDHVFKILNGCPCRYYIQFVLGKPFTVEENLQEKHESDAIRKGYCGRYLRFTRYYFPLVLLLVFSVDFGDWLLHNEDLIGISATAVKNRFVPVTQTANKKVDLEVSTSQFAASFFF